MTWARNPLRCKTDNGTNSSVWTIRRIYEAVMTKSHTERENKDTEEKMKSARAGTVGTGLAVCWTTFGGWEHTPQGAQRSSTSPNDPVPTLHTFLHNQHPLAWQNVTFIIKLILEIIHTVTQKIFTIQNTKYYVWEQKTMLSIFEKH